MYRNHNMNPQEQLATFITQSRAVGKGDELIRQELIAAGWQEEAVTSAFSAPLSPVPPPMSSQATVEYAGFWHRVAASVADGILLSLISLIFVIPLVILEFLGIFPSEAIPSILFMFINIGLAFAYYPYMEAKKGQTFGKQFIGIKVIKDETGQLLSFGRSCGRFLSKLLSALPLGIGFIMAGFTKKKQALHDLIVGAVVVKTPRVNKYRTILTIILGLFGPMLFFIFIVPFLIALMFGAALSGFSSGMEFDEVPFEEFSDTSSFNESFEEAAPVSLTTEELDGFITSTTIGAIIDIDPGTVAGGYTLAGPAIVTWDNVWNDEIILYIPAFQGIAFSDYVTVDILEVFDNTGTNVYVPGEDSGLYTDIYWLTYDVDGVSIDIEEASWDFGSLESIEPMQQVRGTVRFNVPLESGEIYERSFDFNLERQATQ